MTTANAPTSASVFDHKYILGCAINCICVEAIVYLSTREKREMYFVEERTGIRVDN